jgi:hypothetical protein
MGPDEILPPRAKFEPLAGDFAREPQVLKGVRETRPPQEIEGCLPLGLLESSLVPEYLPDGEST